MSRVRYAPVSTPAAGSDWSFSPSGVDDVKVLSISGTLTTNATAGSRVPVLQLVSQDNVVIWQSAPSVNQSVSLADVWTWDASWLGASFSGLNAATTSVITCGMANLWIPHLWTWRVKTTAIAVADQWSSVYAIYVDPFDPSESQVNAYTATI